MERSQLPKGGMGADCGAITTCSYHKLVVYYSRTIAYSGRRSMLSSSGDFLRTLSSILSGEGLDEREQGKSPLAFLAANSAVDIKVSLVRSHHPSLSQA
jgi:hypothetical protein